MGPSIEMKTADIRENRRPRCIPDRSEPHKLIMQRRDTINSNQLAQPSCQCQADHKCTNGDGARGYITEKPASTWQRDRDRETASVHHIHLGEQWIETQITSKGKVRKLDLQVARQVMKHNDTSLLGFTYFFFLVISFFENVEYSNLGPNQAIWPSLTCMDNIQHQSEL